ncbi:hypothetical protein [Myxococcus sp. AS-1-15]|uniref:hypothetical protein n=1 Tax=Myxococcus sp. AS-1-15 TaxID=2874600 RepID=UPI001CBF45CE|nr:hypothetical protein [Myxococcus sp. AS-1-15]MBZ4395149.1 hypothetical protein [Myxococcus sp. AS-1-15]
MSPLLFVLLDLIWAHNTREARRLRAWRHGAREFAKARWLVSMMRRYRAMLGWWRSIWPVGGWA